MDSASVLKTLGKVSLILGVAVSLVLGVSVMVTAGFLLGLVVIVGASLSSIISSSLLIGFGELIELNRRSESQNREIIKLLRGMKEKTAFPTLDRPFSAAPRAYGRGFAPKTDPPASSPAFSTPTAPSAPPVQESSRKNLREVISYALQYTTDYGMFNYLLRAQQADLDEDDKKRLDAILSGSRDSLRERMQAFAASLSDENEAGSG